MRTIAASNGRLPPDPWTVVAAERPQLFTARGRRRGSRA